MHAWILNGLTLFSFHIHVPFQLFMILLFFMSLNACLDIKWAYLVFLSYFWNYSCPLMHAWILNGLTLFSFHNFGIIHVP